MISVSKDNFTLTDICAKLNVSLSWVKKEESTFKLDWGSGTPGKKSTYDKRQFEFFKRVTLLTRLGFTLKQLKEDIYDKEVMEANIIDKHFSISFLQVDGRKLTEKEEADRKEYEEGIKQEPQEPQEPNKLNAQLGVRVAPRFLLIDNDEFEFAYNNIKFQRYKKEGRKEAKDLEKNIDLLRTGLKSMEGWLDENYNLLGQMRELLKRMEE